MAATVSPRRVCTRKLRAGCPDAQAQLGADVAAQGYAILRLTAEEAAPLEAAGGAPPPKKTFEDACVEEDITSTAPSGRRNEPVYSLRRR